MNGPKHIDLSGRITVSYFIFGFGAGLCAPFVIYFFFRCIKKDICRSALKQKLGLSLRLLFFKNIQNVLV